MAWYLADDLKMTDATPKGYAQASANESEPTPADIKDFQDTLKAGFIKMFVFNSQEANSTIDQITGAAKDANVPIVELAEQGRRGGRDGERALGVGHDGHDWVFLSN